MGNAKYRPFYPDVQIKETLEIVPEGAIQPGAREAGSMTIPGTVFGKALEPLAEVEGMIYVFVTLR